MKILIISQFFKPDITAAAFRISDFVDYLKDQGHEVLVITGYPHKSEIQDYDFSQERNIVRIKITNVGEGGFVNYLKHYFSFMFKSMWKAWKNRNWSYEVIFVSSPPLFVGFGGILLQSVLKTPLLVEIRDIWPDTAVAAGQLEEEGLVYRFARFIEKQIYKRAKAVAAVSKPMAKYISEYRNDNVTVCYNGVKLEKILNRKKQSKPNSKRNDDFTIAYTGNIGLCQAVGVLVEVGNLIKQKGLENIKIRIIGGGAEKNELQLRVKKDNLGDIIKFEGPYPKDQLDEIVDEEVDILFLNLKDHPVFRKTIPSKLFDYLFFEKPVIYGIYGEGKEILDSLNIGESFVRESPESLLKAIQNTIKIYDEYQRQAKKLNLNLLEKLFSREDNFEKLTKIIYELTA